MWKIAGTFCYITSCRSAYLFTSGFCLPFISLSSFLHPNFCYVASFFVLPFYVQPLPVPGMRLGILEMNPYLAGCAQQVGTADRISTSNYIALAFFISSRRLQVLSDIAQHVTRYTLHLNVEDSSRAGRSVNGTRNIKMKRQRNVELCNVPN